MESVVLVIHLFLALAIIGLVLLQRSEGGGLGIGGGSGGLGGFATAKGTANALTRATAICAAAFFITSLTLGVMAGRDTQPSKGLLESIKAEDIPVEAPVADDEPMAPTITYEMPSRVPGETMPQEEAAPAVEEGTPESAEAPVLNEPVSGETTPLSPVETQEETPEAEAPVAR